MKTIDPSGGLAGLIMTLVYEFIYIAISVAAKVLEEAKLNQKHVNGRISQDELYKGLYLK